MHREPPQPGGEVAVDVSPKGRLQPRRRVYGRLGAPSEHNHTRRRRRFHPLKRKNNTTNYGYPYGL